MAATSEPASDSERAKAGMASPAATRGSQRPALRSRAEQRERAAPQPLESEGEVGDPRMAAEGLADQAEGADVQTFRGFRDRVPQPSPRAQPAHDLAAGAVEVPILLAFQGSDLALAPGVEIAGQRPVGVREEGPGKKGDVRHPVTDSLQFPSKTGFSLAAKAR